MCPEWAVWPDTGVTPHAFVFHSGLFGEPEETPLRYLCEAVECRPEQGMLSPQHPGAFVRPCHLRAATAVRREKKWMNLARFKIKFFD